jgi:hypothetical protein
MSPMISRFAIAAASGAAVLAAGMAPAAAQDDRGSEWVSNTSTSTRACFQARRLEGFAKGEPNTVNLRTGVNEVYQVRFQNECWTLQDATQLAVQSRNGATDFICAGSDAEIVTKSPISPPQHCVVKEMRKLSVAEIAALPGNQRP